MSESTQPGWKRGVAIGLGAIAIILSILVFAHPGMTVVTMILILGILLIIVGIEKIISGIFVTNKSRWGTVGLGLLALIFGSIALGYPVSTAVFVLIMLGIGLLFTGVSHVVYGVGNRESGLGKRVQHRCRSSGYCFVLLGNGISFRWCDFCICHIRNSTFGNRNRNHCGWSNRRKNENDTNKRIWPLGGK
jgi:Short repeat of unknown function (DUF308)